MKAVVLEEKNKISIHDIQIQEELGPKDVRIDIKRVGICGSDIHYYTHGKIGPFVVNEPMVLGHEASGVISEVGSDVEDLKPGDRVCMEPGIPGAGSRAVRLGMYNLDPDVRFWATPPVHGVLRPSVVHPAAFTFKLPDKVSLEEGAMVEPLAIGVHAAGKAEISPGDTAVVTGAGTIGLMTAAAALASGCSRVIITDVVEERLQAAASIGEVIPVNVKQEDPVARVMAETGGWGADLVFEASGSQAAADQIFSFLRPGGRVVYIGMPVEPVRLDIVAAQAKEASVVTIFRYAHAYPRTLNLLASGSVDVKPFITESFSFEESVKAFDYACNPNPTSVKIQITL